MGHESVASRHLEEGAAAAACCSLQPPASPCWFWTLRAATSRSERATRSCGERGGMLDSERPLAALRYCWWCCWPAGTGSWGRWWGGKSNSPRASAFLLIQSTPHGPAGVARTRRRQPCPLRRPPPPPPPTPCRSNRRRPSRPSRRAVTGPLQPSPPSWRPSVRPLTTPPASRAA